MTCISSTSLGALTLVLTGATPTNQVVAIWILVGYSWVMDMVRFGSLSPFAMFNSQVEAIWARLGYTWILSLLRLCVVLALVIIMEVMMDNLPLLPCTYVASNFRFSISRTLESHKTHLILQPAWVIGFNHTYLLVSTLTLLIKHMHRVQSRLDPALAHNQHSEYLYGRLYTSMLMGHKHQPGGGNLDIIGLPLDYGFGMVILLFLGHIHQPGGGIMWLSWDYGFGMTMLHSFGHTHQPGGGNFDFIRFSSDDDFGMVMLLLLGHIHQPGGGIMWLSFDYGFGLTLIHSFGHIHLPGGGILGTIGISLVYALGMKWIFL